jgi:aminomethyltransferase
LEKRPEEVKRTPFFELHQHYGGKIVPFAGFEMPVQYKGIVEEHKAVRNSVGVFDVSHMGEFFVDGVEAESFLQHITINDLKKLTPGKAQYSAMMFDDGGIIDDLLIYKLGENSFMVVVNAANIEKDFDWMKNHCPSGAVMENKSDETALLAVQGPSSLKTLQKLTPVDLASIPYYSFVHGKLGDVAMTISRTGYTGELGFELYFPASSAKQVWESLFDAGKEFDIVPVGLGARDTLRMEMGYCLYGNDIDQTTNPLEAGLGWITKLNKGGFIGKNVLEKVKSEGVKRKLVGMILEERAIPRHGYAIAADGNIVGSVTSGTFSPSLEKGIALGYVSTPHAAVGSRVAVDIRGRSMDAVVTSVPFLKKN